MATNQHLDLNPICAHAVKNDPKIEQQWWPRKIIEAWQPYMQCTMFTDLPSILLITAQLERDGNLLVYSISVFSVLKLYFKFVLNSTTFWQESLIFHFSRLHHTNQALGKKEYVSLNSDSSSCDIFIFSKYTFINELERQRQLSTTFHQFTEYAHNYSIEIFLVLRIKVMDSPLYKRQFVQQYNPKDFYHSQDILSREVCKQFSVKTEKNPLIFFSVPTLILLFTGSVPKSISQWFPETSFWACIGIRLQTISYQEKEAEDCMGRAPYFRWIHVLTGCSLHSKVEQMVEYLILDFGTFGWCWSYDFSFCLLDQSVF